MKRLLSVLTVFVFLTGCSRYDSVQENAMLLRDRLLSCESCQFTAVVTADYGDEYYTFTLDCDADSSGAMTFSVLRPESIAGITGVISDAGGNLTFDDKVLAFETVADGLITPVSAPWLLLRGLRSGYFSAFSTDGDSGFLQIDDSYRGESLQLDIWLDEQEMPVSAQISWQGRRILSITVEAFTIV